MALWNIKKRSALIYAGALFVTLYCATLPYWREVEKACSHGFVGLNPNRKWNHILLYMSLFCFSEIHAKEYKWIMGLFQAAVFGLIANEYSGFGSDWEINQIVNFWLGFLITIFVIKFGDKVQSYKKNKF